MSIIKYEPPKTKFKSGGRTNAKMNPGAFRNLAFKRFSLLL
jgi:hypothetical protein